MTCPPQAGFVLKYGQKLTVFGRDFGGKNAELDFLESHWFGDSEGEGLEREIGMGISGSCRGELEVRTKQISLFKVCW